jgi:hypothetical protein
VHPNVGIASFTKSSHGNGSIAIRRLQHNAQETVEKAKGTVCEVIEALPSMA